MNDNTNNETCPFEEIMKFLNKDKPNNETAPVEDKPKETNSDNKNYCPEMAILLALMFITNHANGVDYYKGKAEAYKEVIDSLITDEDCE